MRRLAGCALALFSSGLYSVLDETSPRFMSSTEAMHFLEGFFETTERHRLAEALDIVFDNLHRAKSGDEEFLGGFCYAWLSDDKNVDEQAKRELLSLLIAREIGGPNSRVARILLYAMALGKHRQLLEWFRDADFGSDEALQDMNEEILNELLAGEDVSITDVFNLNQRDVFNSIIGTFSYVGDLVIVDTLAGLALSWQKSTLVNDDEPPTLRLTRFQTGRDARQALVQLAARHQRVRDRLATYPAGQNPVTDNLLEQLSALKT